MLDSIMAGAAGYMSKQIRGSDLAGAVRAVASGRSLLDPCAASRLTARLQAPPEGDHRLASLSARQRATLELIGEGLTNRQIGDRLGVSEMTVKNYVTAVFVKLGLQRRTQAAAYAARARTHAPAA
jgi:two-component system, NarL family, response regulator DevR